MRTLATSPTPVLPSASIAPWRPLARHDHLVMNQVGDEVLVYDETTHAIPHLNPTSQAVWSLCDGTRTPASIGQAASAALGAEVSEDVVRLALGQLTGANLLVGATPTEMGQPRSTRRVMLRRMAVAGGVALPALVSISAPAAAAHASCHARGETCSATVPCCAGNTCANGICATSRVGSG